MALLTKSNLSSRRRLLLLVAAALLLAAPCVAAARLSLRFETQQTGQADSNSQQQLGKTERAQIEKMVVDLEEQAQKLKQSLEVTPQVKKDERAALEARLAEVQRNLEEHRRALEGWQSSTSDAEKRLKETLDAYGRTRPPDEAEKRLKELLDSYERTSPADEGRLKEVQQLIAKIDTKYPGNLELIREVEEKLAAAQAANQGDRKPRLLSHNEPRYTDDARAKGIEGKVVLGFTIDHDGMPQSIQVKRSLYPSLDQAAIEAVREWRFEPALKNGQPVSMWMEAELNFSLYQNPQSQEEREARERREKELVGQAQMNGQEFKLQPDMNGQEIKVRLGDEAGRRAEREAQEKRDAILAGLAKISMDHAIQIANTKVPGKVTECSLVGERWQDPVELAKPSMVFYHVVVLSDEATPVKSHVLINAIDGSVISVKQEDKREEEEMRGYATFTSEGGLTRKSKTIEGGVLNTKASSLPAPSYPAIAKAAHASGEVGVRVVIDADGNVVEATPISGHPLLQAAAQAAAKDAKFNPTRLKGEPVMVSGVLVYNFIAQ